MGQQSRRTTRSRQRRRGSGPAGFPRRYLAALGVVVLALGAVAAWLAWPGVDSASSFALPGPPQHIHGLAADPHGPGVLWVATHRGLVRHTEGRGWERVGPDNDYMGFAVHPTEPGVLYTSGHPGPGSDLPNPVGLQVSRDGGLSWDGLSLVGQADFHVMAVSPADPQFIYGLNVMDGGLYRSEDGGRTWENLGEPQFSIFGLAAHPLEPRTLMAATDRGLLLSRDGGMPGSWEQEGPGLAGAPVSAVAFHPQDPGQLYAFALDRGLVATTDAGERWARLAMPLGAQEAALYISMDPADPDRLYIATNQLNIHQTTDGGGTWTPLMQSGRAAEPSAGP